MIRRSYQFAAAIALLGAMSGGAFAQQADPGPVDDLPGGLALPAVVAAEIDAARAALDDGDAQRAGDILQPLVDEDPNLHEACGLLGVARIMQGDIDGGRALIDSLPDDPSAFPAVGRTVSVLEETDIDRALITPYRERALKLARLAADNGISGAAPYLYIATMASRRNDMPEMRRATAVLIAKFPNQEQGHFLAAMIAGRDGDWTAHDAELLEAERLGMPAEIIQEARTEATRARAAHNIEQWKWYIAAGLLAAIFALFLYRRITRPSTVALPDDA